MVGACLLYTSFHIKSLSNFYLILLAFNENIITLLPQNVSAITENPCDVYEIVKVTKNIGCKGFYQEREYGKIAISIYPLRVFRPKDISLSLIHISFSATPAADVLTAMLSTCAHQYIATATWKFSPLTRRTAKRRFGTPHPTCWPKRSSASIPTPN